MTEKPNAHAVKLAELMAAHRDGQDGSDCCDINDPGSCETCATLDGAISALSAQVESQGTASAPDVVRSAKECWSCGSTNIEKWPRAAFSHRCAVCGRQFNWHAGKAEAAPPRSHMTQSADVSMHRGTITG